MPTPLLNLTRAIDWERTNYLKGFSDKIPTSSPNADALDEAAILWMMPSAYILGGAVT